MTLTESDIADHAFKALRLSRKPEALATLKAEILVAARQFLEDLDLEIAERAIVGFADEHPPDDSPLREKAAQALRELAGKRLKWFANLHDWRSADANPAYAAGHIIRRLIDSQR